jgi:ethanolamine utilization protein EutQ (cupin superfamily)
MNAKPSPAAAVISPASQTWEDLGVGGELAEIKVLVGPDRSESFGLGLCRFSRVSFDWTLSYDECVHVLEGAMEVRIGDDVLRAESGELLFLPNGTELTYVVDDHCVLSYTAYPVDWQERLAR